MKTNRRIFFVMSMVAFFWVFSCFSYASAEEYEAMKGIDSAKAVFDVRDGSPKSAAEHMKLIYFTFQELQAMAKNPVFVVVFMGSAVKLISGNTSDFKYEDQKYLDVLANTISKMSGAGIELEVCLAAVNYYGVNPASIKPEFKQVGNGWISEIGYQAQGYSLVPVY